MSEEKSVEPRAGRQKTTRPATDQVGGVVAEPRDKSAPPGGDVDVEEIDPGSGEGELQAPLSVEDQVVLGEDDTVDDRLVGRRALVTDPGDASEPWDEADAEEILIGVTTRDEVNASLVIPLSSVTEIIRGGRNPQVRG